MTTFTEPNLEDRWTAPDGDFAPYDAQRLSQAPGSLARLDDGTVDIVAMAPPSGIAVTLTHTGTVDPKRIDLIRYVTPPTEPDATEEPEWGDYTLNLGELTVVASIVEPNAADLDLIGTQVRLDDGSIVGADMLDPDGSLDHAVAMRVRFVHANVTGTWTDGIDDYTWDGEEWTTQDDLPYAPDPDDALEGRLERIA